jgi:hypothetical protein
VKEKIMTFESVHHTLRAEKTLRLAGLTTIAINTPRRLSSDCGISLKFAAADESPVVAELRNSNINYKGIYEYAE